MTIPRMGTPKMGNLHTEEVARPSMSPIDAILDELNRSLILLGDTWHTVHERLTPVLLPDSSLIPVENEKLCGSPSPIVARLRSEVNMIYGLISEMQDTSERLEL